MPVRPQEAGDVTRSAFAGGTRLLAFRVVQLVIGLLTSVMIARALGVSGRGEFALVLNLAAIAWTITQLEIEAALGRMLARKEATITELSRVGVGAALVLGPAAVILTLAIGVPLRDELLGGASIMSLCLAAACIPFALASQYFSALLFRVGALRDYGIVLVTTAGLQLLMVVVILVSAELTPESTLATTLAVAVLTAAGLALAVSVASRDRRALLPTRDARLARQALVIGLQLHPNLLANYLLVKIDLVMVGLLAGVKQAGLYSLAATLQDPFRLALTSMAIGALERQTSDDEEEAAEFTADFMRQNAALTLVAFVLVSAIAYPGIVLAYGAEWTDSVLPFIILVAGGVCLAPRGPADGMLVRIAPPLWLAAVGTTALIVNIALNLALIPALGINGAALASLISYALAATLSVTIFLRLTGLPLSRALGRPRRGDIVLELPTLARQAVRRTVRSRGAA